MVAGSSKRVGERHHACPSADGRAAGSTASPAQLMRKAGNSIVVESPAHRSPATMALGVNVRDEVVGTYTVGSGNSAVMHGFTWTPRDGFATVDDPHGIGTTTINGVNDHGDLVGFYVDSNGNTDGFMASPVKVRTTTVHSRLQAMPQIAVALGRDGQGDVTAAITGFGLTPGSTHEVELTDGGMITGLGEVTANDADQVSVHLDTRFTTALTPGSLLEVLNGTGAGSTAAEPIAEATLASGVSGYHLTSVEAGYGTPRGAATLVYNPAAQTISVTVNASGLMPGAHAAHIHLGSCQSQGAVQYMLMDFTTDANGRIVNQTRTVTGVTTPVPATGWYLNLHQGDGADILSNGQPTISFRPLLCANI